MNARADVNTGLAVRAGEGLLDRSAERLVVVGFRCWMAGYEYGSIECWEVAWNTYASELGAQDARRVFGDLQYWVRSVRQVTHRTIRCFPHCCRYVCRDECMALSLVSALQEGNTDLARTSTFYLTEAPGSDQISSVTEAAGQFAFTLLAAGRRLLPVTPVIVENIANCHAERLADQCAAH